MDPNELAYKVIGGLLIFAGWIGAIATVAGYLAKKFPSDWE